MTPKLQYIVEILRLCVDDGRHYSMTKRGLAAIVWPPESHPKAWRHSANGGPPAWTRTLGKMLRRAEQMGLVSVDDDTVRYVTPTLEYAKAEQILNAITDVDGDVSR